MGSPAPVTNRAGVAPRPRSVRTSSRAANSPLPGHAGSCATLSSAPRADRMTARAARHGSLVLAGACAAPMGSAAVSGARPDPRPAAIGDEVAEVLVDDQRLSPPPERSRERE